MADFVAVLRKTIDGLADNTPALREKVYEKARATVAAKLAAINPPPPAAVADRQKRVLEDAIREVEASYSGAKDDDPFAELENVFAAPVTREPPPAPTAPPPSEPRPLPVQSRPTPPPLPSRTQQPLPPLPGNRLEQGEWRANEPEAASAIAQAEAIESAEPYEDEEQPEETVIFEERPERRRRSFMPLVAAVVVVGLMAGGGYAVWLNKDDFLAMLDLEGGETVAVAPSVGEAAPVKPPATAVKPSAGGSEDAEPETPAKYTQRLNTDGSEIDPGPAGGIASIGEGTSVAAATQLPQPPVAADAAPADTPPADPAPAAPAAGTDPAAGTEPAAGTNPADAGPAAPASPTIAGIPGGETPTAGTPPVIAPPAPAAAAPEQTAAAGEDQVAVGQKAIFYEEKTSLDDGSAEPGNIVWSLVQESPGDGQPAEPAIHGEASIPGKDIELRLTIRRNADKTLPASHIIELIFLTPEDFDGGGVDKVLRFALKPTEEEAGNQLLSIPPTKVADGYFLVALNDANADIATNLELLRAQEWIDVPVVYENGRRALITLEKGIPGDKVFDEVIKAWQSQTAG